MVNCEWCKREFSNPDGLYRIPFTKANGRLIQMMVCQECYTNIIEEQKDEQKEINNFRIGNDEPMIREGEYRQITPYREQPAPKKDEYLGGLFDGFVLNLLTVVCVAIISFFIGALVGWWLSA